MGDRVTITNNHFDQDGLCAVTALLEPQWALENRQVLEAVATAGDFLKAIGTDRRALKISITIATCARIYPSLATAPSALPHDVFLGPRPDVVGKLYTSLSRLLPDMLSSIDSDRWRTYWQSEIVTIDSVSLSLASCQISRLPHLDLAIIHLDSELNAFQPCYPYTVAINSHLAYGASNTGGSPDCYRVLIGWRGEWSLYYRYESRIIHHTTTPLPRLPLWPLRDRLAALETLASDSSSLSTTAPSTATVWSCDDIERVTPVLRVSAGRSRLTWDEMCKVVVAFFEQEGAGTAIEGLKM
ncbi:hypothetical protein HDU93_007799 [Gonapodya sp. JEL0774]|nr:hypothetical protein HDU93_007799 [Gonapodya sp. JEL0774]